MHSIVTELPRPCIFSALSGKLNSRTIHFGDSFIWDSNNLFITLPSTCMSTIRFSEIYLSFSVRFLVAIHHCCLSLYLDAGSMGPCCFLPRHVHRSKIPLCQRQRWWILIFILARLLAVSWSCPCTLSSAVGSLSDKPSSHADNSSCATGMVGTKNG